MPRLRVRRLPVLLAGLCTLSAPALVGAQEREATPRPADPPGATVWGTPPPCPTPAVDTALVPAPLPFLPPGELLFARVRGLVEAMGSPERNVARPGRAVGAGGVSIPCPAGDGSGHPDADSSADPDAGPVDHHPETRRALVPARSTDSGPAADGFRIPSRVFPTSAGASSTETAAPGRPAAARLARSVALAVLHAPRVVAPGGLFRIRYEIYNAEETAIRVRTSVVVAPPWELVVPPEWAEDRLLEGYTTIEEEVGIAVPGDAEPGETRTVDLVVEVVGEAGGAEAPVHVRVATSEEGTAAGRLTGSAMLGLSQLGGPGEEGMVGGVVDLSGDLGPATTAAFSYRRGPDDQATNYRWLDERTYASGHLTHGAWEAIAGNEVFSAGTTVTGPTVSGVGATVRRTGGSVRGEITVARPTEWDGSGGGHLWRGRVGINGRWGSAGLAFSDHFRRRTVDALDPRLVESTLDPDSLDVIEREWREALRRSSWAVRGGGADADLRLPGGHRLSARVGALQLSDGEGATVTGAASELQYAVAARAGYVTTRWRRMPPSLTGINLPGDEVSLSGVLRLPIGLRLIGRGYRVTNRRRGDDATDSELEFASGGMGYSTGRWSVQLLAKHRSSDFTRRTIRRTGELSAAWSPGPFRLTGDVELGRQRNAYGRYPYRSFRTALRWNGRSGYATLQMSSYASSGNAARQRVDALASVTLSGVELAGGAWGTRGPSTGAPGVWSRVGLPLGPAYTVILGADYAALGDAPDRPILLGSLGVRTLVDGW